MRKTTLETRSKIPKTQVKRHKKVANANNNNFFIFTYIHYIFGGNLPVFFVFLFFVLVSLMKKSNSAEK